MKLQKLLSLLVESDNRAADDLLLEALRLGNEQEQSIALEALIRREKSYGLVGVLAQFADLPKGLKGAIIDRARAFYFALSEAGRGENRPARLAAIKIIAAAKIGKLSYVLSENLRETDDEIAGAACFALMEMARWVNSQSRLMHRFENARDDELTLVGTDASSNDSTVVNALTAPADLTEAYQRVMRERPEIESAVARSLDWSRSKHIQDLLRAALLLCDHPQSKTLAILKSTRHGGQASMVRKLQQPPSADHVEAFLLGASHGHLRTNFATAFAAISETHVLNALLRRTYWLLDNQLHLCIHNVDRGTWWSENTLAADLAHRPVADAMRIADWIAASGLHDTIQDQRLAQVLAHVKSEPKARLRVLRQAAMRPRGASTEIIKQFLDDSDERLVRIAVREIIRRRPAEAQAVLLQRMTQATESVRRLISRAIGQTGFEQYWRQFDRLERPQRRQAGRAMLKLMPDAVTRIGRYLTTGTIEQRVRALQMVQELELADRFRDALGQLCLHANARVRSKAVSLLVEVPSEATSAILEKVLADTDARVRANAIEVLEAKRSAEYVPMLAERARSAHNRERANAIKALHRMRVGVASEQLAFMLNDQRQEHRISALWTLRHIGLWGLVSEVGRLARADESLKVRRYAAGILKSIIDSLQKSGALPAPAGSPPVIVAKVA
ncbi:MAG: HEAT repeat domain-containing protein [Burkholderiales bacterium]|nr:HEAT repeat domain-containing protein [Phycisphaerae bacterium]